MHRACRTATCAPALRGGPDTRIASYSALRKPAPTLHTLARVVWSSYPCQCSYLSDQTGPQHSTYVCLCLPLSPTATPRQEKWHRTSLITLRQNALKHL